MTGERIPVASCAVGEPYMVDCEDGHPPYRMVLRESIGGKWKFSDEMGGRVDLTDRDSVWRVAEDGSSPAPAEVPLASVPAPVSAPSSSAPASGPCGAPGCGEGCAPGWVKLENSAYALCAACGGKGATISQAPVFRDDAQVFVHQEMTEKDPVRVAEISVGVVLSERDLSVLSSLLRDRVSLFPPRALSERTWGLLRRLRLADQ